MNSGASGRRSQRSWPPAGCDRVVPRQQPHSRCDCHPSPRTTRSIVVSSLVSALTRTSATGALHQVGWSGNRRRSCSLKARLPTTPSTYLRSWLWETSTLTEHHWPMLRRSAPMPAGEFRPVEGGVKYHTPGRPPAPGSVLTRQARRVADHLGLRPAARSTGLSRSCAREPDASVASSSGTLSLEITVTVM